MSNDTPIYDNLNNPRPSDVVEIEVKPVTTDENGNYTAKPTPKVIAATSGAGIGAAVGTLIVYAWETIGAVDLPAIVEGAITVIAGAGIAYLAGWLERPAKAE